MKKIKYVFIPIIIICMSLSLFVTACAAKLDVPENVSINLDNYTLFWSRVDNARGYVIEVTWYEGSTKKTQDYDVSNTKVSYSLQSLDEGDYEVRIKASAGTSTTYSDSDWSKAISMNKDYYSGCSFSLISNGTEYEVTGWSMPSDGTREIIIPAEYRGKPVVGIADNAFKSKSTLVSVEVEDTEDGGNLRYIGKNAFYSCTRLESVTLPDSVTEIGEGAFHSCRVMTEFNVPAGVTEIQDSTFLYCNALVNVDLGNVETIGASAFLGCKSLAGAPKGDETIATGEDAVAERVLTIPGTVQSVGEKAFSECTALTNVVIGSGIGEITSYAFYKDTALKTVEFEDSEGDSSLEEMGSYSFSGCTSLESVTLPQGLETIDSYAFYGDTHLYDINIPASVSGIGAYAFDGTAIYSNQEDEAFVYVGLDRADGDNKAWVIGLNSDNLVLSGGATTYTIENSDFDEKTVGIADRAFYRKTILGYVNIPSYIHYIGDRAFYGCTNVSTVIITGARGWPEDVEIGSYAFASMSIMSNFRFAATSYSSGVKSVGDHAFYNDTNLAEVDIPDSVESIGAYAFTGSGIATKKYAGGNGLDEDTQVIYAGTSTLWVVGYGEYVSTVGLKSGTVGIADYAFTRDSGLQYVTNLGDVKHIGEGAFYKCSALLSASVPEYVEEIKPYTFYGCDSLVSFGSGIYSYFASLKAVGRSAFYGCASLNGLDFSYSSLEYIGKYAFYGCSSLYTMQFNEDDPALTEIDDYAFYKSGITEMKFPCTLERIGDKAFYKCTDLTSIEFEVNQDGESENHDMVIGDYAFYKAGYEAPEKDDEGNILNPDRVNLETLTIPGRVKEIGAYAFYKCCGITSLTLEEGVEKIGKGAFGSLAITSLKIPSSVREIGAYAFKSCSELNSLFIPSSVEVIDENAFYGLSNATLYTDAEDFLPRWSTRLNSSYRPMVWGCQLSEDGSHIISVKISSGSVANVVRIEGNEEKDTYDEDETDGKTSGQVNYSRLCGAPEWEGHEFLGWSLKEGGDVVLSAEDLDLAFETYGVVTLFAVWD